MTLTATCPEEIPVPRQPPSLPGQRDLYAELQTEALQLWRRCTRCADLDQDRPQSIYPYTEACCPVCLNPEFTFPTAEQLMPPKKTAAPTLDKPKTAARTAKAAKAASAIPHVRHEGELVFIDLHFILDNPKNSRDPVSEDDPEILEMAATIKTAGLVQPLIVRPDGTGDFILIAGHRRSVACRVAGLEQAPCIVRELSDKEAALQQIIENGQRKDLNPIEEARDFRLAMDELGFTQTDLALSIGKSQGHISNRLRLLNLPATYHGWISSRDLTPTQGRTLAVLADLPQILEETAQEIAADLERREDPAAPLDQYDFEQSLGAALDSHLRPMGNHAFPGPLFKPTPKQIKELDVRTVELDGTKCDYAVNVELWDQLQAAAEQSIDAAKKGATAPAAAEGEAEAVSPEEAAAKAAEVFQKRLYRYQIAWTQNALRPRLVELTDEQILLLMVALSLLHKDHDRMNRFNLALKTAAGTKPITENSYADGDRWEKIFALDRARLRAVLVEFWTLWCDVEARSFSSDANPVAIERLARELGVDFATQWNIDHDFLQLHTTHQLADLVHELKIDRPTDAVLTTKRELINHILEHRDTRQNKQLPACLANLTPVNLD